MRTTRLGRTDLVVSEMGFGAFGIGGNISGNSYGPTDDETSISAIHAALDLGCTFFDTADVYGYGHSERLLGRALRRASRLDDVVIATKVGGNFSTGRTVVDFSREHISTSIDASLRRLGRDRVDLYQLHNPSLEVIERGEVFDVLDDLVAGGKVRHYGVSVHTRAEGQACLSYPSVAALQVPYNLFTLLHPENSFLPLFGTAVRCGVGLIAREPLAGGFLSGRHTRTTTYGPGDIRGQWPPARQHIQVALTDSLRYLESGGATLAQVALRFVLDEPTISTTVVGIKTADQARENLVAVELPGFATFESDAR